MLAGNSLREVKDLPEGQDLLVRQLLKYQCPEMLPQFKPCRLVRVENVWKANDADYLKSLLNRLLMREHRDSRILFSVFELVLNNAGANIHTLLDNFDLEPIRSLKEFQEFLSICIEKLPLKLRGVFVAKYLKDKNSKEVCKEFDITPSNYWTMVFRSKVILRTCLMRKGVTSD